MDLRRRAFLLNSAAFTTMLLSNAPSGAQPGPSSADNYRQIFGMPNLLRPVDSLRILKDSQDQRTPSPRDVKTFERYVDRLPLIRKMQEGLAPELFHLMQWNAFALELTSQDHASVQAPGGSGPDPLYAEQIGPHRSSWALAIIHLAIFEAVNTIYRRAESYRNIQSKILADTGLPLPSIDPLQISARAAIAIAAHDTMVVLYPNKALLTETIYRKLLPLISDSIDMQEKGARIGQAAARQVLLERKYDYTTKQFADGSQSDGRGGMLTRGPNNSLDLEPEASVLFPMPTIDEWRIDLITEARKAIGGYWQDVEPFVLNRNNLPLPPGPPPFGSKRFEDAYSSVRRLGGDPFPSPLGSRRKTKTARTGTGSNEKLDDTNETFKGIFWAYDGTALLCAPPRLYNMIATSVVLSEYPINEMPEMARYLALINLALADAGIAAWTAKYRFKFPRPVTYIRLHNPETVIDESTNKDWTPLGAPVSNGTPQGANLTPPFPAYPSGHAVFGAALFQTMRRLLPKGADPKSTFKFISDEYNGLNRGPSGDARPMVERQFETFEIAERENAQSRIWLGIHWQFDADDGIDQGRKVGNYIVDNALKPL